MLAFAPAILVLTGAILVALGTFWSGFRQSNFNAEIRRKNELIIQMQEKDVATLKGADYLTIFVEDYKSIDNKFKLTAFNPNDLPVYDVYIVIRSHVDMPMDTPEQQKQALSFILNPDKYEIGNIATYGVKDTGVSLEPGYYQIDIRTRYAKYTEMLKFGPFNGVIGKSISVTDIQGKILHQSTYPEGFKKIY